VVHGRSNRTAVGLAIAALVIAMASLTGLSEAARELLIPRDSVGTAQLRSGAVTSAKVRNGSLLRRDFRQGALPRGGGGVVAVISAAAQPAGLTLSAAGGRTQTAEHLAAGAPGRTFWLD